MYLRFNRIIKEDKLLFSYLFSFEIRIEVLSTLEDNWRGGRIRIPGKEEVKPERTHFIFIQCA